MKQGQDITARFPGILIVHQKIRDRSVGHHQHDDHEIFLPLQGEIQIHAAAAELKAGPGKMIYIPPSVGHSFRSSADSQGERLIFIIKDEIWKSNQGGSFTPSIVSTSQLCKELLFHLLIYPKTKAAKSLIETLVQTISEMLETSGLQIYGELIHLDGRASDERIKNALSLIQSKFNVPIPMEGLAKGAGLSVRNLNRLFLEQLGMTPKQAVTLYRVEKAKMLLKLGQYSVTDVALEVGYGSVSQFITAFRKITGQLPSNFQNFSD